MISQCLTNFIGSTPDVLRSAVGLPVVVTAVAWIFVAVLLIQASVPRRFRTAFILTVYDCLFGLPYIIVQVLLARGNWYTLCLRGKLMWLCRVSHDKAEHYSGQWFPCLMTQRFNYPAMEYEGNPPEGSPCVDLADITEVERAFAVHYGREDAVLFTSAFVGNIETLRAIASLTPDVLFLWDRSIHRSSYEGFRMHRNQSFPHNDLHALEQIIQKEVPNATIWVLVESRYSMEGDSIDPSKLYQLRKQYGVRLCIDMAHSFGVEEEFFDFDVRILSLSKCAGLFGGMMIGPLSIASWIRTHGNKERRAYPKNSIPPIYQYLHALQDGTVAKRANKVHGLSCFAYDTLVRDGWHVRSPRGAYILCVQVATPFVVGCMQQWCVRHGIYLAMIGYPGIPWRHYLGFRIIINAALTQTDLQHMADVMRDFLSPRTFVDVLRDFWNPKAWGWGETYIGLSDEPTQKTWCEGATRLVGGNSMEQLHLESILAAKYGYDHCRVTTDSEFGIQAWKQLIPTIKVVSCIDEMQNAEEEDAVVSPLKPFGLALFCRDSVWKDEFWLRQKMLVFSIAAPSYVLAHKFNGL
jgi:7-keto-8-aminopelargonate synthetase-like enzyme